METNYKSKIVAIVIVTIIFTTLLLVFKIRFNENNTVVKNDSFLVIPDNKDVSNNRILSEQASLFDSLPLFIPTRWNYGGKINIIEAERNNTLVFENFTKEITLNDSSLNPSKFSTENISIDSSIMEERNDWLLFSNFGELTLQSSNKKVILGELVVIDIEKNLPILKEDLPTEILNMIEDTNYFPFEFYTVLYTIGQIGKPFMIKGSNNSQINKKLTDYVQTKLNRVKLTPGYYRVLIGL